MDLLQKTTMIFFILGNCVVNAGTMGNDCTSEMVSVPCVINSWDLGAQALYLKPSYTAASKVFAYGSTESINGFQVYKSFKNDWEWGFKLEGSYHFNTGNDVAISWYHWHSKTTELIDRPSADLLSRLLLNQNDNVQWNAVNVEAGQLVHFSGKKDIRFHGGLQLAHLEKNTYAPYTGTPIVPGVLPSSGVNNIKFEYKGLGPRIGMDMAYQVNNIFSIYNTIAAALLIGNNSTKDISDVLPDLSSFRGMSPEMEAKLGAKLSYFTSSGTFVIDGGYMWINYFNTFYTLQTNSQAQTIFALHGPFLGAKWIG